MKGYGVYNAENIPAIPVPSEERKTDLVKDTKLDPKPIEPRMDPLTARLRRMAVEHHMEWVE